MKKRTLGRTRHTYKNKIKIDLTEISFEYIDWTEIAENRVQYQAFVSTIMNVLDP